MEISPEAGKPATTRMPVNIAKLVTDYYSNKPDPAVAAQRVVFGTSGHRVVRIFLDIFYLL
jgi:phosphoglucomutase